MEGQPKFPFIVVLDYFLGLKRKPIFHFRINFRFRENFRIYFRFRINFRVRIHFRFRKFFFVICVTSCNILIVTCLPKKMYRMHRSRYLLSQKFETVTLLPLIGFLKDEAVT
jgi:hypothetical protein